MISFQLAARAERGLEPWPLAGPYLNSSDKSGSTRGIRFRALLDRTAHSQIRGLVLVPFIQAYRSYRKVASGSTQQKISLLGRLLLGDLSDHRQFKFLVAIGFNHQDQPSASSCWKQPGPPLPEHRTTRKIPLRPYSSHHILCKLPSVLSFPNASPAYTSQGSQRTCFALIEVWMETR